tara:strand:- start:10 stop:219 length:210 start_codon:yes stop_codon:yes gene_type:complete
VGSNPTPATNSLNGGNKMLEELEKVENKWMTMREYLPPSQHRHWKESYLNKTVLQVRIEIKKHLRRNKK